MKGQSCKHVFCQVNLKVLSLPSSAPVEIEVNTVPHFEGPVNGKNDLCQLECDGTFDIQTSHSRASKNLMNLQETWKI